MYKVGDKVKIKEWKKMQEEYKKLTNPDNGYISFHCYYSHHVEAAVVGVSKDRILTIRGMDESIGKPKYLVEGIGDEWVFVDEMIEYSLEEYAIKKREAYKYRPTVTRADLMDFED